jgi:hypothetical protein
MRIAGLLLLSVFAVGLSGCHPPTEAQIVSANWVPPRALPPPPPIYCYRTLADSNCYAEPVPGFESRFIESFPTTPPGQIRSR